MTLPASIGRYTITGELGRGAMGVVYRAVDPTLDRAVAVKVIAARTSVVPMSGRELEARFVREARMASRISHPGVVAVHDAGREGDLLYLVMELVDGESLAARLARGAFPPPAEALEIVAQVADALGAAHALGIVHRDVKPGNIVLARDGRVRVADFGVAKAIGEDTNLTRTGTVVGSPAYMAPEQIRGEEVDGRADLFSLGAVLYELLLCRRPFPADTVTTLIYQILHEDPLADPEIAQRLGEEAAGLLRRALAKRPAERIVDAAAFAASARGLIPRLAPVALESTTPMAEVPIAVPVPSGRPGGGARRGSAFPTTATLIVGGAALLVLAALFAARQAQRTPVAAAASPTLSVPPGPTAARAAAAPEIAPSPAASPRRFAATRPAGTAPPPAAAPVAALTSSPTPFATRPPVVAVFHCRRGAEFNVSPEEAVVSVEGKAIGIADEWDGSGGGQTYTFPHPGKYLVKLSLAGYRDAWIEIVVEDGAEDEVADVDLDLAEIEEAD